MRVVAIGNDRVHNGEGERFELSSFLRDGGPRDLVLVYDDGATVCTDEVAAAASSAGPDIDLVVGAWTYTDATHGTVERRGVFSPERLRWANTAGPVVLVSGDAMQRSGWGADGHPTLQDLLLRLSELDRSELVMQQTAAVLAHAERVAATSGDVRGAVERHLKRVGIDAVVVEGHGPGPGVVVERIVPEGLTATVVVPTTGKVTDVRGQPGRLVINMLDSLFADTDLPLDRFDIVLVIGPEADADIVEIIVERFGPDAVRFITSNDPFCHSQRTNLGVLASSADVVVLLNDDTEVVSPGWLGQIATAAVEPGVGLVGPLLRYPDGTIQSAGHVHPPINIGERSVRVPPSQYATMLRGRDVAGVTLACAAVARRRYLRAGGLSPRIHNGFNDVDLGMKLEKLGFRHVSLGHVELVHLETATREPGVRGFERAVLAQRWASSMTTEHLHFSDQVREVSANE